MRITRKITYLFRALFRRSEMNAELHEELAYHVTRETEEQLSAGADPADAQRIALARFGGVTHTAESTADARGTRWLDDLATDFRYALRLMRRSAGFTALTVLIAAFGIGTTTLVFSAVNGVLIRPLPFTKPNQLAMLNFRGPDRTPSVADDQLYATLSKPIATFAGIGGYSLAGAVVTDAGEPRSVRIERLTPSLVTMLGVSAAFGRTFTETEASADAPVVVLGHTFWRQHFAADSTVLGRTLRLDGEPFVVIGVMPNEFGGPLLRGPDLYRPLRLYPTLQTNGRTVRPALVVRMNDGVTLAAATNWLATNMNARGVNVITNESVPLTPHLSLLTETISGDVRQPLVVLLAAVALVLALVVANVTTLLLARASAREREMAMRRALGASRGRQIRQVLTETLVLTGAGGVLGMLVARFGLMEFRNAGVNILPRISEITLDWRVIAVAVAVTAACGVLAGILPALTATHGNMTFAAAPDASARMRRRDGWRGLRATFVMIEISMSVVLLVGAGLIIKGFLRVAPSDPGFTLGHRTVLSLQLHDSGAYEDAGVRARLEFATNVARRMEQLSGVSGVAFSSTIPLVRVAALRDVKPEVPPGDTERAPVRSFERSISANYFDMLGIPIVAGRAITAADDAGGEPVAVVNQTAAARYWPGLSPIGRRLSFNDRPGRGARTIRVVGVAHDTRFEGTDTRMRAEFFIPYAQGATQAINFIVAASGDQAALTQALKQQVWAEDARQPIDNVETLAEIAGESVRSARFYAVLMAGFAAVALAIAAAGMFGMLSYMVVQRRREIGIRLALGAPRGSVTALVLRQCVTVAAIGLVAGIVAARMLTRFLASLLLEVSPTDARVFAMAAAGVLVVAVLASLAPAMRAASVDPIRSLRAE